MSTVQDQNANGEDYLNYKFVGSGFVTDEELFGKLELMYQTFAKDGLHIKDEEGLQDSTEPEVDASGKGDHPDM